MKTLGTVTILLGLVVCVLALYFGMRTIDHGGAIGVAIAAAALVSGGSTFMHQAKDKPGETVPIQRLSVKRLEIVDDRERCRILLTVGADGYPVVILYGSSGEAVDMSKPVKWQAKPNVE